MINSTNFKLMLQNKIIGTFIILLNMAGLGFVLYMTGLKLKEKWFSKKHVIVADKNRSGKKKKPSIKNDDIIPDEDDLLKDMDLSDLDHLNLDDFE